MSITIRDVLDAVADATIDPQVLVHHIVVVYPSKRELQFDIIGPYYLDFEESFMAVVNLIDRYCINAHTQGVSGLLSKSLHVYSTLAEYEAHLVLAAFDLV